MSKKTEYWIVKGIVQDLEAYPDNPEVKLGDTEWQISDGPPGERGMSSDYIDLEEALADHPDALFHWSG